VFKSPKFDLLEVWSPYGNSIPILKLVSQLLQHGYFESVYSFHVSFIEMYFNIFSGTVIA